MQWHSPRLVYSMTTARRSHSIGCFRRSSYSHNMASWHSSSSTGSSTSGSTSSTSNIATLRLYRVLQRQCKELSSLLATNQEHQQQQQQKSRILLQPRLDPHQAGSYRTFSASKPDQVPALWQWFVTQEQLRQQQQQHHPNEYHPRDEDADYNSNTARMLHEWHRQLKGQYHDTISSSTSSSSSDDDDSDSDDWDALEEDDQTLWTDIETLQTAIRFAFRQDFDLETNDNIAQQQQWAIRAFQLLRQTAQQVPLTSTRLEHGIRVTATSTCIGRSMMLMMTTNPHSSNSNNNETKYRFAYRIRIENCSHDKTVQLLGRTWNIQEMNDNETPCGEPMLVQAPQTGAVGRLPVLEPGQVFEYASGAELTTPVGQMQGCFHMAVVPEDTPSAQVGMPVQALMTKEDNDDVQRFQVPVAPFWLRISDDVAL